MSDVVKIDVERVFNFYKTETEKTITHEWMSCHALFLSHIKDLSEEFHRKYATFYKESHWDNIAFDQTELSEQFYEDFLNKFRPFAKSELIISKKISEEFIKKHLEDFDQECWSWVY
jgi:hypothetical protein